MATLSNVFVVKYVEDLLKFDYLHVEEKQLDHREEEHRSFSSIEPMVVLELVLQTH